MSDEPSKPDASLEEQLVAYLDGELDAEAGRHIEELLASDPKVRSTLHDLERSWELLEELDPPATGEKFTQSTLEMVALVARQEVEQALAEVPRRSRRRWVTAGFGALLAVVGGFLAVAALAPNPNRQLLRDLPILERFDEYRRIPNIEFLRTLCDKGLFSEPAAEAAQVEMPALQPRQRIANMSAEEKGALLEAEQRFTALDQNEQRRLRQLHEAIQKDPNVERLRQTMRQYSQWLRTLPLWSRSELVALKDPAERVASIEKQLAAEQVREQEKPLGEKDSEVIVRWVDDRIGKQEAAYLQSVPEEHRQEMRQLIHDSMRLSQMRQWRAAAAEKPAKITDEDLSSLVVLRAQLSSEAQKVLENKSPAEQWALVMTWTRHALRRQPPGRPGRGPALKANDERLAEFFDGLSGEDRDRLLRLPGEEMQQQLLQLYVMRLNPNEKRDGRREGSSSRVEGPGVAPPPDGSSGEPPLPKRDAPKKESDRGAPTP